jgi:hypothetical protein
MEILPWEMALFIGPAANEIKGAGKAIVAAAAGAICWPRPQRFRRRTAIEFAGNSGKYS